MRACPKCQAPEEADWSSAVQVMTRVRIRCLMGHSRWVDLVVQTEAPARERDVRAGKQGRVDGVRYPPADCVRCGKPMVNRLALNQIRHGACALLEVKERRKLARARLSSAKPQAR